MERGPHKAVALWGWAIEAMKRVIPGGEGQGRLVRRKFDNIW